MSGDFPRISPGDLHARLLGDGELALLDVREEGISATPISSARPTPRSAVSRG